MLFHCPQVAVGLEGPGLRTGLPGDRDKIYVEAVCGGWRQELSELEMFRDDKRQLMAKSQLYYSHVRGAEEHKD